MTALQALVILYVNDWTKVENLWYLCGRPFLNLDLISLKTLPIKSWHLNCPREKAGQHFEPEAVLPKGIDLWPSTSGDAGAGIGPGVVACLVSPCDSRW